jgi:hypothetical protein
MKKWFLIILGSLTWSLTMIKSGWAYPYGLGFWGANGHDGIWHITLAESLSKGTLAMPIFAGAKIQNYHIGFDLLLALLHKFTSIPVTYLYFQVLPPVLAVLIGLLTYKFIFEWTKSKKSALWSTFFVYFGGGLGWIIGRGESAFWSTQAVSTLINPPFALSLIFILLGLIFLVRKKFVLATLCFGILIEIKAYGGILILGALFVSGIYRFVKEKKFNLFLVFLGALVLSLILYFPLNKNSAGLLIWQPFWFLETMMQLTDRVGWVKFGEAMVNYRAGGLLPKALFAYGVTMAIFVIGNFGTRMLFLFRKMKLDEINIFFYSVVAAGIIIPTFLLQKGTPWNTIQFFYYSLFFSGILAGVAVEKIKNKILLILIILFTIPTTFYTLLQVYIPGRPPAMLSNTERSALSFLSKQPDGAVLTYPFDAIKAKEAESFPPRPLYVYTSTAYVSAFSGQPAFFEDEINLDITGYDWKSRKAQIEDWYRQKDPAAARKYLKESGIKYVYWVKPQRALLGEGQLKLTNIFENGEVIIYRVD